MNFKDLIIAECEEGFELVLNADDDGGFVSIGEDTWDITGEQARKLAGGDIGLAKDITGFDDLSAR